MGRIPGMAIPRIVSSDVIRSVTGPVAGCAVTSLVDASVTERASGDVIAWCLADRTNDNKNKTAILADRGLSDEEMKSLLAFLGPLDCGDKLESNLRSRDPVVRVGRL